MDASAFAINNSNIFAMIASFIGDVFLLLDRPILFGNITFLRLLLGFIVLSACITIFWKGARG